MMRRWLVLVVLVAVWLGVAFVELVGGTPPAGLPTAAVGLGLLAALVAGETLHRFGVPRLLGYVAAGVVLGPAAGFLDARLVWHLVPLETTALALLAFQAGFCLDIRSDRAARRPAVTILLTTALLVPALTGLVALGAADLLPALASEPGAAHAFALVAGTLALGTSPVVLSAVFEDSGAAGRLSNVSLSVALAKALLVPLALALALSRASEGLPDMATSPSALADVTTTSVGLGVALAMLVLVVARSLGRHAMVPLLVLVLAAMPLLLDLGAEPVLAFAVGGLAVRWSSGRASEEIGRGVRRVGLPAALVLFTLLGADLPVPRLWPVAAAAGALFVARALGLWIATALGNRLGGRHRALRGWGWLAFLPQGPVTLALLSLAVREMGAAGRATSDVLGLLAALHLIVGPLAAKLAVRRAGELPTEEAEEKAAAEEVGEAEPTAEEIMPPKEARPDPLLEVEGPHEATPNREWRRAVQSLVLLRSQVRRQGVQARIDRIGDVLRVTGGQARQTIQVASEACGRAEDAEAIREALLEHRENLASQNRSVLEDFAPPALDDRAVPVLHLLEEQVEQVVREAPAELLVPETTRVLTPAPGDPAWVRASKLAKRALRAAERFFGRPRPLRTIPFRRIVRRVVAGELVSRMSALETLVARAEFKAFRRLETLLRSADWVLVDALERVDDGSGPEETREYMQECLVGLREASREARDDLRRLADEPMMRFSEEAARAARRIAELADVAGTFQMRERDLRYASVAPGVREAVSAADVDRRTWGIRQAAILERIGLGLRLVEMKGQLREAALEAALGPPQRMHSRIGELLRLALDRARASQEAVARPEIDPTDVLKGLLDELRRRVARPVEGVMHALRSAGVVDRLVGSLDTVTAPLPEEVSLLPEAEIVALLRGQPTAGEPVPVAVRRVSRTFFDQRITVRLVEHMRALETSAEEAVAGIRDAMRLLTLQVGREDRADEEIGEEQAGQRPEPSEELPTEEEEGAETRAEARVTRVVETLDAVAERLEREIDQTSDTSEALVREVGRAETGASMELWSRLQEEAARGRLEHAAHGVRRWAREILPRLGNHPRIARIREEWGRIWGRVAATWGRVEARADLTLGGPERIRLALRELTPAAQDLPYVYGKLFSLDPTENDAFVVDRDREMALVRERIRRRGGGAIVVAGRRGSGRSSLVRVAIGRGLSERPIVWLEADRPFHSAARLHKWVARAAGITDAEPTARGVAAELRQRAPILVLDGLERMVERSARGLEAMEGLASLIAATSRSTLWIMTAETSLLRLMEEVSPLGDLFGTIIRMRPLGPDAIRTAVERRHRLSGLDLKFRGPKRLSLRRLRWRLGRTSAEDEYFRRLARLSRGRPRTALQLWTLSLDPVDDRSFEVRPCPRPDLTEMSDLPPHLSAALAVALAHGVLDRRHLQQSLGWPAVRARAALHALAATGLLEARPRTDGEITWMVPPWSEASIQHHLRERGLLASDGRAP
ncbi:MAG: hypothetical protein ACQEXJ_14625 [Myxococcota bacterium]